MEFDSNKSGKDYDYVFKIVLIGDTCVGKSCLLIRFSDDQFSDTYHTTIGVDFWDTAGQERYKSITNAYYRGAEAIVIVFDLTNRESFSHINDWIEEITKFTGQNVCKLVIANKSDLKESRKVTKEEVLEFERKYDIKVVETSAKSNYQVELAFKTIVELLIEKKDSIDSKKDSGRSFSTNSLSNKNKSKCCY